MELTKVQQLIEAYFEGNTTLNQEQSLRDYFKGDFIDDSVRQYISIFNAMSISASETSTKQFKVPVVENRPFSKWWISIAASLVIIISVAGFVYSNDSITDEEQKALAALKQSQEAMLLLSKNLQKGAEKMQHVEIFSKTKNKFLK